MKKAFTLVELLIVIALIAILSVAVLATINPIEQTNKARDAKFKNDAAEVLSAYERYFASLNDYPWNESVGTSVAPNAAFAASSMSNAFGVLGTSNSVGTTGLLITNSELKSSFVGKESFASMIGTANYEQNAMYIFHNGNDANYVCFCPKASVNRTGSKKTELKCLGSTGFNAATGIFAGPTLSDIGEGTCASFPTSAFDCTPSASAANLMCVPEGEVQ